jgi:hypothetical protein
VAAWVGQRRFVWFDDHLEMARCLDRHVGLGEHLVVTVDPATGLTPEHVAIAHAFLTGLGG